MNLKRLLLILSLIVFCISPAIAGVNLKNGNFYISYTDLAYDDDFEISRTYNSRSTDRGIFGFGWGSDYETYLIVFPDKTLSVHENGSGAITTFAPSKIDKKVQEEYINKLVEVAGRLKEFTTPAGMEEFKQKVTSDKERRETYWAKYKRRGMVESPNIPVGTVFKSNTRGIQTIRKIRGGYLRISSGIRDYFNEDGQLERVTQKDGRFVKLEYDADKNLKLMSDNIGRKIKFIFNNKGFVESLEGDSGKKATYRYGKDTLLESKDTADNIYKYGYDSKYNLTKVSYTDNSAMEIFYNESQFVKRIRDKYGDEVFYQYFSNPKNPRFHYWTTVRKKNALGKSVTNRYEYIIKTGTLGNKYTQKIITTVNNVTTSTEYNQNALPIVIKRGNRETSFAYDSVGRMIRKETQYGITQLTYHKRFNKIVRVENTNKGSDTSRWTNFKYSIKGNLIYAESSKGKKVSLEYNDVNQIVTMITQDSSKLKFTYNEAGKPIVIAMDKNGEKIGAIRVKYDENGEIEKVDSDEGPEMALRVTQAFQSLLSLVKPAGVNLNL